MRVLFFLLLVSNMLFSLPSHYVSTTNISVGETFTYTIELPPEVLSSIEPDLSTFDVVDSTIEEDEQSRRYQYELQAFTIESLIIPTVSITEVNSLPPTDLAPIYLALESTLPPTANELNDIAPLFGLFHVNLLYVWVGLLLFIICVAAFISYTKRKKLKLERSIQQEPPITIALKEIKALQQTITNDQASIKAGYFKLTEIICKFLTKETNINVLDATTVEMKRLLKSSQTITNEKATTIIQLSEKMDHYKFSKDPILQKPRIDQAILDAVSLLKGLSQ